MIVYLLDVMFLVMLTYLVSVSHTNHTINGTKA